ncbi:molybdate-binding periplasmic protein [Lentisphaera araneosa HTCC2155]|uniref:Molybdate-binding periplasmic protein n=1 Tax=Lentisphaera araneosa HTCC2155 TaxID=313628 RepID=A6DHY8_9BACT|nr:molybdate ABC transporter substrate-binding protein [Lentisphaera araneosa]EDM28642.1 molybdate-binding periplasmic protein [Lentisphaera araneosa HTCC2155]
MAKKINTDKNLFQHSQQHGLRNFFISVIVVFVLGLAIFKMNDENTVSQDDELLVYCAAGIRMPIKEICQNYENETGVKVQIEYGSSGELESKIQQDAQFNKSRTDLYIPADNSFTDRTLAKKLSAEQLPLASFRLVLALKKDDPIKINSFDDLFKKNIKLAICNERAGAGKKTKDTLMPHELWDKLKANAKVIHSKVTECAASIKSSQDIRAGIIWDTTAKQFDLRIIDLEELNNSRAEISVNLISNNAKPSTALHLARYLSAPESAHIFEKYAFTPNSGDSWASQPALNLYCGGVNKNAVSKTIKEFEEREGVKISTSYAGCGTLVASIKADSLQGPDGFMTCDASYYDKVKNDFIAAKDVSSTEIVILVRKGNPKNIKALSDLQNEGIKFGTTNPKKSTLGYLSWKMLRELKIEEQAKQNAIVTTPTAHELLTAFSAHDKLDAALVYTANCALLNQEYELIPIQHPLATAIQNISINKKSKYPLLMGRLIRTLKSDKSRQRFLKAGFQWQGEL